MPIDANEYPFLFSTTTRLARQIDNDYYKSRHYVWVALKFNDASQAASSNPYTIAINFIQEAATYDRHSVQIKQNIAGITRGAKVMKEHGAINGRLRNQIIRRLDAATYDDFLPLIYVIDTRKVAARIIPVPPDEAARPDTPEYKILDLRDDEYTVIDLAEIVSITRSFPRRRVDFAGL